MQIIYSIMNPISPLREIRWKYALVAGIAGAIASVLLTAVVYAAAMPLLFNSQYQSKKVLDVYNSIQPLPLLTTNIGLFLVGFIIVSMTRTLVFAWLYKGMPGTGIRKGLSWGLTIWLTMILFTEFYTAINLLGEPLYLAAVEFSIQLPVYLGEGAVAATVYGRAWK